MPKFETIRNLIAGRKSQYLMYKKEYHYKLKTLIEKMRKDKEKMSSFKEVYCPVCGKKDVSEVLVNPEGFSFSVCKNNQTIYMNPAPSEEVINKLCNSKEYSFNWNLEKISKKKEYESFKRIIGENIGGRLLDIGCASGEFVELSKESFDSEGVEINKRTAETGKKKGLKINIGTVYSINGKQKYDVITMFQVIEHLTNPKITIKKVNDLLKSGGYLYIETPNMGGASFKFLRERHTHISNFGHVCLFNKNSLVKLIESSGFKLKKHEFYGGLDFSTHDIISIILGKKFKHRMALYNSRLYYLGNSIDKMTCNLFPRLILGRKEQSYQRALFKKL